MTEEDDKLASIDWTMRELLRWTRFANMGKLKEILENELDSEEKKLAYESTDGKNGQKEVAELSGAPLGTVKGWWPRWFQKGIVTESEIRTGRMMRLVSLEDVGIEVPKKKPAKGAATQPPPEEPADEAAKNPPKSGGGP
jgi:hypothetical protein